MNRQSRFWIYSALVALMLAGAALRVIRIGASSMWVDEANTYFSAESILETGLPLMPTGYIYGRAPLYTYSAAWMYQLLGVSLESARITSALFGVLSILLVFLIAALLFGWRAGLVSAFCMAFGFYEIGWSRVARMYTQFQFFTLLGLLVFILGFERQVIPKSILKMNSRKPGESRFLKGVDWVALILFVLIMVIAYFGVHQLTALTLFAIAVYILVRAGEQALSGFGRDRWLNKYALFSVLMVTGGLCMVLFTPAFIQSILAFFDYTPAWAKSGSSASDPWVLIKFLFSWQRFPLGLLFVWGSIQLVTQKNRTGWMALIVFIVPLFFLSFVFTHRHPKYLFGVYPLYYMVAAYGLIRLTEIHEGHFFKARPVLKKFSRWGIPLLIGAAFLISPWLRIAKNIPWLEDGRTNGAVYFNEWKEAARILDKQMQPDDLVICSLPEALLYYGIASDWALNHNNLSLSSEKRIVNREGHFIDVYAGRPLIASLPMFEEIIRSRTRGWILMTAYHFEQPRILPPEIRHYLETRFTPPQFTKNRTVCIYHWNHHPEAAHAF